MSAHADTLAAAEQYPVEVRIHASTTDRDRLTSFFRFFFALPHLVLVGGPIAVLASLEWTTNQGLHMDFGSGGILGAVVALAVIAAWFAILITGRHPEPIWRLSEWYLRWRVRAVAYMTLLRDEYPPFGDGSYAAQLDVERPEGPRDRLTVALRPFLAIPHLLVLWVLNVVWAFTTAFAWAAIVLTGRYPEALYGFAIGVVAWTVRVEAYVLLLRDEYPPFTLRA